MNIWLILLLPAAGPNTAVMIDGAFSTPIQAQDRIDALAASGKWQESEIRLVPVKVQ